MDYIIRDIGLAPEGEARINWVKKYMPLLNTLEREFIKDQSFKDKKVTVSVHLESKTAYLALVLAAGGDEEAVYGLTPLGTDEPIAAALANAGLKAYASHGGTDEET